MTGETSGGVERMQATVRSRLVLEQRVPEAYSATRDEHRWHQAKAEPVDVTTATAAHVFEHADVLRDLAPPRNDYEYRVVLVSVETTGWVLG